jgi:hypothetical protein
LERSGSSDEHYLRTDAKYTEKHGSLKLFFHDGIWLPEETRLNVQIQELAEKGLPRREIAERLGMRKQAALDRIRKVLGPVPDGSQGVP